jgi:ferredoxin
MGKIKKITVDRNLCIGVATCMISAGKVFEFDGENKAVVNMKDGSKTSGPVDRGNITDTEISDETLIKAAQSCPTKAIILHDEEGKQIYP